MIISDESNKFWNDDLQAEPFTKSVPVQKWIYHVYSVSFFSQYFWRLGENGPMEGYPAEIRRLWPELPDHVEKIDAAYQSTANDGVIRFFIGKDNI